ncbi:MAG: 30S ribosomal protein S1 [Rickettsia sp.]|nr:30S ribosomal protein S1 [Rickettsia sp.]
MQNLQKNEKFVASLIDFEADINLQKELETMMSHQNEINNISNGDMVKGKIIEINNEKDFIIVYVEGLKNEVQLPISELSLNSKSSSSEESGIDTKELEEMNLSVGSEMDFIVERTESKKGVILSRKKILISRSWSLLEQKYENGEYVEGVIFGKIKGGFTVNIDGVVAFLPGSQVDVRPVMNPDTIMHINQQFQILKMDKKFSNIIVSRKAVMEDARSEEKEKLLSTIHEGTELKGVVKNITDYGAFIDLGSIDGLLHVTDISWTRINHPSEILKIGQEVNVIVIQYDKNTKKVSLGMKQLEDNPWKNIQKEFELNKKMKGKITNIADYGIFIELKKGIEGLVHLSELSWNKNNYNHKKSLKIGQIVEFVIISIDEQKHRISLSMKHCIENPLIKFADENPIGSVIKAPIRNVTDFGIFVAINDTQDAMIHESDLSWDNNGQELIKNYKKGDLLECKVLTIDVTNSRVTLGVKQMVEPPKKAANHFKKNMVVTCVVSAIRNDSLDVIVEDQGFKIFGFIKESDLAFSKYDQNIKNFREGDRFDAKIIALKGNKVALSVKLLEQETRAKVIKEYGSTSSGASLEKIIGAAFKENLSDSSISINSAKSEDISSKTGKIQKTKVEEINEEKNIVEKDSSKIEELDIGKEKK